MIIDAHCHLAPPEAPGAPSLKDVDGFLERKAADGIDRAVVVHGIVRIPGLGGVLDRCKRWDEFNLGVRAEHPDRVSVIVGVDPFEGDEALEEARHAIAAGACGFTVSSTVDGRRPHDPAAEDLWSLAEELDVPVMIHPPIGPGLAGNDPRLEEFAFRSVDVGLSVASMIFAGVLDRHPSLRLIAAAGGGGLAGLMGRLDAAFRAPALAGAALAGPPGGGPPGGAPATPVGADPGTASPASLPSSYLDRIYVDTLMFSEAALRCAVDVFGADHMLFGTDWPPVGIPTAISRMPIDRLELTDAQRAGMLGGNAAALLKLS